jgi:hypothetical protein
LSDSCQASNHQKTSIKEPLLITISIKMVVKNLNSTIEFKGTKYADSTVCRIIGGASGTSQKSFI